MPSIAAIKDLPGDIAALVSERWRAFEQSEPELASRLAADPVLAGSVARVWGASEFVSTVCVRRPEILAQALAEGRLTTDVRSLQAARPGPGMDLDEDGFMAAMRRYRELCMLAIAWRDIAGWATLDETLGALSSLADESVEHALAYSARQLAARHGWPGPDENGEICELLVLGMGKLGARELNFSSDIDLVFLYPSPGRSSGERPLDHETWFTRQARKVIRLLDARTEDGFVFRVDMRLRPFGDSGPLVTSLSAFEVYLQKHGRDWERYAYVKARLMSGSEHQHTAVREILRPFVYRRYLDFGMFESLRSMKEKVARETRRKDREDDIKLGQGGIREIEFIIQCFQLVRGGSEPGLRVRGLLDALAWLGQHGHLDAQVCRDLAEHYRFLRALENRLQAIEDRQTHQLPADVLQRQRLALAMGSTGWPALQERTATTTRAVRLIFNEIVFGPVSGETERNAVLAGVWEQSLTEEQSVTLLREAGFGEPREILAQLSALHDSSHYRRMDEAGRGRLDRLMPLLLLATARRDARPDVLRRIIKVIEAVGRRSAYFALLNENPMARRRLVSLCARSQLLTDEICAHPLLLDELIDPRVLQSPPTRETLAADLERRFADIDVGDLEAQMETLRNFQRASVFRVALADLSGALPLMKVSDRLTELAELVLAKVVMLARAQLVHKHGEPTTSSGQAGEGFGVIGYGKLGGLELGYSSDLDLVFVYDGVDGGHTSGPRQIDNSVFYARLATRIVHMLATQTRSGRLYESDTRLRPSGKKGLLVVALEAFSSYQEEQAWTWEHQALLRARMVVGDPEMRSRFREVRARVLCRPRELAELKADISGMRKRMREELDVSDGEMFDLKQGTGGIADIEFIVQYLVLRHAATNPRIVEWSDNIRQLESLATEHLISPETAETLTSIYRAYRKRLHRLALDAGGRSVPAGEFSGEREFVSGVWHAELGDITA